MQRDYQPDQKDVMTSVGSGWTFEVGGTGFAATLGFELDFVPVDGPPIALREHLASAGAAG